MQNTQWATTIPDSPMIRVADDQEDAERVARQRGGLVIRRVRGERKWEPAK